MQPPRPFQPHSTPGWGAVERPQGNLGFSNSSFRRWVEATFSMLASEGTSLSGQDPWDSSEAFQSCQQPLPLPSTLLFPKPQVPCL